MIDMNDFKRKKDRKLAGLPTDEEFNDIMRGLLHANRTKAERLFGALAWLVENPHSADAIENAEGVLEICRTPTGGYDPGLLEP